MKFVVDKLLNIDAADQVEEWHLILEQKHFKLWQHVLDFDSLEALNNSKEYCFSNWEYENDFFSEFSFKLKSEPYNSCFDETIFLDAHRILKNGLLAFRINRFDDGISLVYISSKEPHIEELFHL